MRLFDKNSNRGFSLVSVMIAAVVGVIIAMAAAELMRSQQISQNSTDVQVGRMSLIRYIMNGLDCVETISVLSPPNYCNAPNLPVEIRSRRASDPILVKKFDAAVYRPWELGAPNVSPGDLTQVGDFYLAAVCDTGGNLRFYAKKVRGMPNNFKLLSPEIPWSCVLN